MIVLVSYNARYVKYREVKKPSFPDFRSVSAIRLTSSRFGLILSLFLHGVLWMCFYTVFCYLFSGFCFNVFVVIRLYFVLRRF